MGVHEFAHKKLCDAFCVPIHEIAYFRLETPAGYVLLEESDRYRQTFGTSVAPFLVNTLVALGLLGVALIVVGSLPV